MVATPPNPPPASPPVQGAGGVAHQPARQDVPKRAAPRAGAAAAAHHPTDVEAATRRLDALLAKDTAGEPRKDVPRRGFYLNIVV